MSQASESTRKPGEYDTSWYAQSVKVVATPSQIQNMLFEVARHHRVHPKAGMCACGQFAGSNSRGWLQHIAFEQTQSLLRLVENVTAPYAEYSEKPSVDTHLP